jgi:hypothetical protein
MQLGELKGYQRNIKKEVNDLIWKFTWDNRPIQIERNVMLFLKNDWKKGDFY